MLMYKGVGYNDGDIVKCSIDGQMFEGAIKSSKIGCFYILHNESELNGVRYCNGAMGHYHYSRMFQYNDNGTLTDGVELYGKVYEDFKKEECPMEEKVEKVEIKINKTLEEVEIERTLNEGDDKEIGGFPCKVRFDDDLLYITYKDYIYKTTYYGEVKDFIKTNEVSIKGYFIMRTDKAVDKIIENLASLMKEHLEEIDGHILPNTKDFILTNVFKMASEFVGDISERVESKSLKTKFKSALGLK